MRRKNKLLQSLEPVGPGIVDAADNYNKQVILKRHYFNEAQKASEQYVRNTRLTS